MAASDTGGPKEIDLDNQAPGPEVGLGLSDVLKWAPVLEQVITAVQAALSGGPLQIPAIKVRIAGKHVTIGPTPLTVE